MTRPSQSKNADSFRIRRQKDVDGLEEVWRASTRSAGLPTQEFSWIRACATAFAPPQGLEVVIAEREEHLAFAALLRRNKGGPRLCLLGLEELFEPMDFAYTDETALAALAGAIARMGLPLYLSRVPAGSPTVRALENAFRGRGVLVKRPGRPCPTLRLDASWTRPEDQLSTNRRSLLRRMRRRAEEYGPIEWDVRTPERENLAPLLDEALRVEAASWKGRQGTALLTDPVKAAFFRDYAERACGDGILRLCFLRIGGRAAAMLYAVEYHGAFWTLKTGYDEEFAPCSPGSLLFCEAIAYAAARGLSSFEFLGSVEEWTDAWTRDRMASVSLRGYPAGWRGVIAFGSDAARSAAGRLGRIVRKKASPK